MKDFLQLDGLVYKLIPIKTEINKNNPYEMGRIDSSLMYNIVKSWEWGNSESSEIYHDPETRKNSISFRGNLHRLAKQLIADKEYQKAEEILDLSIKKMPIDYFGYYSLLEPYISTYYKINKYDKGDDLYQKLSVKYDENLKYYSQLSNSKNSKFSIYSFAESIITDTERYRSLLETLLKSKNNSLKSQAVKQYISSTEFVSELYGDYEYYTLLSPFLRQLFISESNELARELYIKISSQFKERIAIIMSMQEDKKEEYSQSILNDYFELRSLVGLIQEYDSEKDYIIKEIKELELIGEGLNKIIN